MNIVCDQQKIFQKLMKMYFDVAMATAMEALSFIEACKGKDELHLFFCIDIFSCSLTLYLEKKKC